MSTSAIKWVKNLCKVESERIEEQLQNGYFLCQIITRFSDQKVTGENALKFGNNPLMIDKNFQELRRLMRKLGLVLSQKEEQEIRGKERGAGMKVVSQIKRKLEALGKLQEERTFARELENKFGFKNSNLHVEKKLEKFYRREEEKRERHYALLELENRKRVQKNRKRIMWKQKRMKEKKDFKRANEQIRITKHRNSRIILGKKLGEIRRKEVKLLQIKEEQKERRKQQIQKQTLGDIEMFDQKVKRGELEVKRFNQDGRQYKEKNEKERQKESMRVMQRIQGKYLGLDRLRQLEIEMKKYENGDQRTKGVGEDRGKAKQSEKLPMLSLKKKTFKKGPEDFTEQHMETLVIEEMGKERKEGSESKEKLKKFYYERGWNNKKILDLKRVVLEKQQKKFEFRYKIMESVVWRLIEISEMAESHFEEQKRQKELENQRRQDSSDGKEEREKQRVEEYLRTLGREPGFQTISERTEESVREMDQREDQQHEDWDQIQVLSKEELLRDVSKIVPNKEAFMKTLETRAQNGNKVKRKNFIDLPSVNDILKSLNRFSLKHHAKSKSFNIRNYN
jgi:hypothetical protein